MCRYALAIAALLVFSVPAFAQVQDIQVNPPALGLTQTKQISAASTNALLVITGAKRLYKYDAYNTNAATAFLKFYNKATAPTCGTDVPVRVVPLVQNIQVDTDIFQGLAFPLGIGTCITAGIADADTANATTGIAVNFSYR